MASVADWSTTAASNTSIGGISTDGNVTQVNQIDNMFRGLMAEVATSRDNGTIAAVYPEGHLKGLTLSNNAGDATNDIDIAVGSCAALDSPYWKMALASALTKRLDAAWAVGTGNGGLDTGSIANTTYHVWLIQRSDTLVVDALFSTSATSPTMPANYDRKRRIGSIKRGSGVIQPFYQDNDYFYLKTPNLDFATVNPGTSAVLRGMNVPSGIVVTAIIGVNPSNTAAAGLMRVYISSPNTTDVAASAVNESVEPAATTSGRSTDTRAVLFVNTDTSGQIRARANFSDASCTLNLSTYGWIDTRGRLG